MQALKQPNLNPVKPNFLIIDWIGSKSVHERENVEWVDNMVSGLSHAIANPPDVVVEVFRSIKTSEADLLIDVGRAIKRNRNTAVVWVIALVPIIQRDFVDRLYEAGVDFIRVYTPGEIDWDVLIDQWENGMGSEQTTAELLSALCPYMHDNRDEGTPDLVTCAAYRKRLVLGPKRLCSVCETEKHKDCTYFRMPRPAC